MRPKPWRDPPPREPDKGAQQLRRRFQRVSRRWEYRLRQRHILRAVGICTLTLALVVVLVWTLLKALSPWPPMSTISHLLAFPNCAAARAVGLAPARRGGPGYWSRHDADNDGVACEPWPRAHEPGVYRVR